MAKWKTLSATYATEKQQKTTIMELFIIDNMYHNILRQASFFVNSVERCLLSSYLPSLSGANQLHPENSKSAPAKSLKLFKAFSHLACLVHLELRLLHAFISTAIICDTVTTLCYLIGVNNTPLLTNAGN